MFSLDAQHQISSMFIYSYTTFEWRAKYDLRRRTGVPTRVTSSYYNPLGETFDTGVLFDANVRFKSATIFRVACPSPNGLSPITGPYVLEKSKVVSERLHLVCQPHSAICDQASSK